MLTIFFDPAGATGSRAHKWDLSCSIQANIEAQMPGGGEGATVYLNGVLVDPVRDHAMERNPTALDEVRILLRPGIKFIDPILYSAFVVTKWTMKQLMPKLPSIGGGKDSPNNSLTGQSNVARAYQAIPDVYGYRRVWPDLIQPSTVEYIDHIKFVTEWMCISRGDGTISQVQYSETPIENIAGASYEIFRPAAGPGYPENRKTTLLDVLETFESDDVNGQELSYPLVSPTISARGSFNAATGGSGLFTITIPDGTSLDWLKAIAGGGSCGLAFTYGSGPSSYNQTVVVNNYTVASGNATFTFTGTAWPAPTSGSLIDFKITPAGANAYITEGPYTLPIDCDRLRWNTTFPRGLKGTVTIDASWWRIDADGVEMPGTRQTQPFSFTADTYDGRYWTTDVIPTSGMGRYRCEFTRKTLQIGDSGSDVAKLEELYAVRYYPTKVVPGVTVFRVTTKATNEATGFSDRKFNVRWLRHVRTLDADVLGTSRNFARAIAHVWTLAGNSMDELDVETLSEINDRIGEASPLLRFDCSLDDADMSLGERMSLIANHARCLVWRDGTKWTVSRDEAKDVPELQFDYRNLAGGAESSASFSAYLPDSHDGVEVEFADETSQKKKAYVRLSISTGSVVEASSANPKKFQLTGCTTRAQALNRGHLEARRLLYQRESITDTALADAGSLGPGSLVRYVDPNDFGGDDGLQAGEVLGASEALVFLSEPVDWKGAPEGRIVFTGVDGRLSAPVRCRPEGDGVRILDAVPSQLYVADGRIRQCGSRYAFGVGITEAEMEAAGLYTLTSLKAEGAGERASIALVRYDARLYEYDS